LNYISGLPLKRGGKIGEGEGKSRKGSGRIRVKRNARELSVKVGRGKKMEEEMKEEGGHDRLSR
jgi:hypothetical protein